MPTISLAELQQYVWGILESNTVLYLPNEVTAILNEGYRIINAFCGLNQQTVTVTSVANQLIYNTPAPILLPLTAWFSGKQLRKVSLGALARNYYGWATDTTVKIGGPVQRWAPVGIDRFVIHPMDSVGGRTMQVTGVIEPTLLVNAGDVIQLEDEFLIMLTEYAAARLMLREGGGVFQLGARTIPMFYRRLQDRMILTGMRFPNFNVMESPSK